MEKIITFENLRQFAYCNDTVCKRPIKGIAVNFGGLGGANMHDEETEEGLFFAEHGVLYVQGYNNPWCWMNKQAVAYTDEVLDVLIAHYQLPQNIPVVAIGASMGGQSALVYAVYAKRTPVACVVNCPPCDLVYHYSERTDLPRTLYSAFFNESGTLEEALSTASPIHLVDQMPDIPYYIFHCEKDDAVNIHKHTDRFVEKMKKDHRVVYHVVPDRIHCDLTDEMLALYRKYAVDAVYNG